MAPLMLCVCISFALCTANGATRQAAELTKNASRQRIATKFESVCFMLSLLRRIHEETVTSTGSV